MCFGVVFRPVERPVGTPRSFFKRSNTCGRNELAWRRACPSSEFVFTDCTMVSVAISNNAMIRSKNWVSLEGIQRLPNYIVRFVVKKRSGIGEGTFDKGAQRANRTFCFG